VRVALTVHGASPEPRASEADGLERRTRRARFDGEWMEATVLRGEPPASAEGSGPCIFELPEATLILPPGWRARVDERGTIAAERAG
jgi:N-methylhydantoinase A